MRSNKFSVYTLRMGSFTELSIAPIDVNVSAVDGRTVILKLLKVDTP